MIQAENSTDNGFVCAIMDGNCRAWEDQDGSIGSVGVAYRQYGLWQGKRVSKIESREGTGGLALGLSVFEMGKS